MTPYRISRFLNRFPELKQRKEQLGVSDTIVSKNYFSESSVMNPFRKETLKPIEQPKYVDIDKLDSVYGNNNGFSYSIGDATRAGDTTNDEFDQTNTVDDLGAPKFYPNSPVIG